MKLSLIMFMSILSITVQAKSWNCRNDVEISCHLGKCESQTEDGFTSMDVSVDETGSMSVCAYTGCWEGIGKVSKSENFIIIIGHNFKFSTTPNLENRGVNIAIIIDTSDNIAILKTGVFAHPLICDNLREKK